MYDEKDKVIHLQRKPVVDASLDTFTDDITNGLLHDRCTYYPLYSLHTLLYDLWIHFMMHFLDG
jgi:hypothetical protein